MSEPQRAFGYSANVQLELYVDDRRFSLHQIGPGSIWLREAADLPPCNAMIVMHVDDYKQEWEVYLPDGLSANSRNARTCARQAVATPASQMLVG